MNGSSTKMLQILGKMRGSNSKLMQNTVEMAVSSSKMQGKRTGQEIKKKQNGKNKQFPKQVRTHTYVCIYIYTYPNPQRPQNKVLSKGPLISPKDLKGPLNWPMDPEASCVYWIGLRDQTTKHLRGDVDIHGRSNKSKYAMLKRCNLRAQNIEPHSSQGQPKLACCPNSFWFPNSTSIEAG